MIRTAALALTVGLLAASLCAAQPTPVLVDHDGDVDDLIAFSLLLKSPSVDVRAITICPGDSYLEPATRATELFVDRLGGARLTIAQGHNEGTHPFPAQWRKNSAQVLEIPALAGVRPRTNRLVKEDAAHHLVSMLSRGERYVILETGPLTNIADALKLDPAIKKMIARIYVMGGAVRVAGNVEQKGHDGSAEWNIYNNPQAAADVFRSGVPITLVPLDATNKVPLTRRFVDRLGRQPAIASQLAAQAWHGIPEAQTPTDRYYFWDTLTAATILDSSIVSLHTLRLRVVTTGASQGRTVEDQAGAEVDVALDADQAKVEKLFLDVLGRNP